MRLPSIRSEFDIRHRLDRVRSDCFRQFHEFLAIVSAQGLIIELNTVARGLTGCTTDETSSFGFSSAPWWFSEVDRRDCTDAETKASKGRHANARLRLNAASGKAIALDFAFLPIFDNVHMIIGVLVHGRPAITDELPFGR